jgi:hypothetical protein
MRPRVRADSLDRVYVLARAERRTVLVRRWDDQAEICRSRDRAALAEAILTDALEEPPSRKLARDYSRFLPAVRKDPVSIAGHDIDRWLATWRPSVDALLRKLR